MFKIYLNKETKMKIAIVGSRTVTEIGLDGVIPKECTEIVSGGASGIDTCARQFAERNGLQYTEFPPDYSRYKRGAPHVRNKQIVEYADVVYAFWDGKSAGTRSVIAYTRKIRKPCTVHIL